MLAYPENLSDPEIIKKLRLFPGVGDKALNDLAESLTEAGYESFDLEPIQQEIFNNKR